MKGLKIETHRVNPVNDRVGIEVMDEPGSGGAHHLYQTSWTDSNGCEYGTEIRFQKGPILENGVNGITQEVLLAIVKHRLECFQAGPFACSENGLALHHVDQALEVLKARTRERMNRGVEGRSVK